jgi:hypothetical protein
VTEECFNCADPQNYAAVALKLQQTAMQAESCIYALETTLRAAINQPALIVPVSYTGMSSSSTPNFLVLGTPIFQNSPLANFGNPLPRGVYEAGLSFNIAATGAVNDNTYRFAQIGVRNVYAPLSQPNSFNAWQTSFESNSGNGMDMGLHTVIESDGNDRISFYAYHGNTSSTCNITFGLGWVVRLSDLDAPRVVA